MPGTYNGRRESRHFELDNRIEQFLTEKLAALERSPDATAVWTPISRKCWLRSFATFRIYAGEYPEYVRMNGDIIELRLLGLSLDTRDRQWIEVSTHSGAPEIGRERVAGWIDAQAGLDRFGDALALACQEDFVIMRILPDGRHLAESLHVLLPSTWNPREKYQQSFGTIHEPVAESARLVAAADNVMKAIVTRGPDIRFGLSLTTLPSLDNHPDRPKPWDPAWLTDLDSLASNVSVRIERQTTYPMPDLGRALFTVRVYLMLLVSLVEDRPDLLRA